MESNRESFCQILDQWKDIGHRFGSIHNAFEDSAPRKLEEVEQRDSRLDVVQIFVKEKFREIAAREREIEWIQKFWRELEAVSDSIDRKLRLLEAKEKQNMQFLDELNLKKKEIEERCKIAALKDESYSRSLLELEVKEKNLEEERENLRLKAAKFNDVEFNLEFKGEQIQARNEEVELEEKKFVERCAEVDLKEKQLNGICGKFVTVTDVQSHQFSRKKHPVSAEDYLSSCCSHNQGKEEFSQLLNILENHQLQDGEIAAALRSASDPGKLVLDVMRISFPFQLERNKNFKSDIPIKSYIILLDQLRKVSSQINAEIREQAKEFAVLWKPILVQNTRDPLEVICFLQFLAAFILTSVFDTDELLSLLDTNHWCKEAPDLCHVLGLADKIPSFIEDRIKRAQHLEAVKYICALDVVDKFPILPILEDYLTNSSKKRSKSIGGQIGEIVKEIKSLNAVIKCIADYKITGLSPENLKVQVAQLQKQRKELHRTQALEMKTRALSSSNSNLDQVSTAFAPTTFVSALNTELQQHSGNNHSEFLFSSDDPQVSGKALRRRLRRQVRWVAPEPGWIKLNTDGALKRKTRKATAGGILRDSNGNWLGGFAHSMEFSTVYEAELWGAFDGLSLAWDLGLRKVVLEMDSKAVLKNLLEEDGNNSLISATKSLLSREWEVRLCHVYRKGNQCADWLADYAVHLPQGLHIFALAPEGILQCLQNDVMGITLPEACPL